MKTAMQEIIEFLNKDFEWFVKNSPEHGVIPQILKKADELLEKEKQQMEEYAAQQPVSGSGSKKIPTVQELREAAKDYPDTFLNGALYVVDKYLDAKQPVSGTKLNNICNNCGFVKGTRDYITSGCEHENGFHSIT